MNWMMMKRKFFVKCRRSINKIKRKFRKTLGQDITEKRKAINTSLDDFSNMFSPKNCYILCVKKGRNKSFMAPLNSVVDVSWFPHKIAFSVIRGSEAAKHLFKNKCFTISQVPREYARDFHRMVLTTPARGSLEAVMRFRAEPAFFIPGYKVKNLPWMECKMSRDFRSAYAIDTETAIIIAEVIHISKRQNSDREKLMHVGGKLFVNTKTISIKDVDKI